MSKAPIPWREGIAPSYLWLPEGEWPSLLAYLQTRFRHLDPQALQQRMAQGELFDDHGQALPVAAPYRVGQRIWYYREVGAETPIPFTETILHQDAHLLVVDKPHFLPMTPGGRFLRETLLHRLRTRLNQPQLTPVHRLDRETAGVVLFCLDPASRGAYQTLFERREVRKVYEAVAPWRDLPWPLTHRSRIEAGDHFMTMQEVTGEPNSETRIELIQRLGSHAWYRLHPHTGRKHQLRVHLAGLGIPIVHDPFYPQVLDDKGDDVSLPLQLLARSIAFTDPLSGEARQFTSQRQLAWLAEDVRPS